jgi:tetratricopeptide (TPR) repeat protein
MTPDPIEANEIRRFEEQYADNPESFVFARLADAYRKAGNPSRALEILDKGLLRHPEYLSGHIVHARSLTDLRRSEEAVAAWRTVLELDPQNLVALRQLADLARAAGDRATAREWAERLLHVDPLNEDAAVLVAETAPIDEPVGPKELATAPGEAESGVPLPSDAGDESWGEEVLHEAGMLTETMADLYAKQGLYEEPAEI